MKTLGLFLLIFILFSAEKCNKPVNENFLYQKWRSSHEESTDSLDVYRPDGFNFPPSRGRSGMEFKSDGSFIYYSIAAGDGNNALPGTWKRESGNGNQIRVEYIDHKNKVRTLYLIKDLQKDKLVISVKNITVDNK